MNTLNNQTSSVHRPSNIFKNADSPDTKNNIFKDVPIISRIFWSILVINTRSRFGHVIGRSKNVPKSIAIDQESLISHFEIIKTPKQTHKYIKKPRTTNKSLKWFAACWALKTPNFGTCLFYKPKNLDNYWLIMLSVSDQQS